jgi:DNA-binding NarL/FixJ family response regulator
MRYAIGHHIKRLICHQPDRRAGGTIRTVKLDGNYSRGPLMAGAFTSSSSSPLMPVDRLSPTPTPTAEVHPEVLLIAAEPQAAEYAAVLRQTYRVVSMANGDVATQYLVKGAPSLVVADGDGMAEAANIIRTAKALATPATVLVIATDAQTIPELLQAGCDAVLLKPFAPNLLYARIGRLLRARTEQQRMRLQQDSTRSRHTAPDGRANGNGNGNGASATTNRFWADAACPRCEHDGVVSFEFTSHRRAWYACLECKSVWMAKRRE